MQDDDIADTLDDGIAAMLVLQWHGEDDAEEHREERDANVGLQVPLLNTSHSQEEDDHRVLFGFLHCSKGINNLTSSGDSTEQEETGEGGGPGSRGSCGGGRWPV